MKYEPIARHTAFQIPSAHQTTGTITPSSLNHFRPKTIRYLYLFSLIACYINAYRIIFTRHPNMAAVLRQRNRINQIVN